MPNVISDSTVTCQLVNLSVANPETNVVDGVANPAIKCLMNVVAH